MLYREAGQFKSTYAQDQQIFPIRQDRIAVLVLLVFAFVVVPIVGDQYWLGAIITPFLILALATLGLNILTGLDIPVELLPTPVAAPAPAAPADINTGGQGSSSTISNDPGTGSAPAGGSTSSSADNGVGSTLSGEKVRDRPRKSADDGSGTTTTTGDGGTTTTSGNGGTDTAVGG